MSTVSVKNLKCAMKDCGKKATHLCKDCKCVGYCCEMCGEKNLKKHASMCKSLSRKKSKTKSKSKRSKSKSKSKRKSRK